jgi:hypothetical protein
MYRCPTKSVELCGYSSGSPTASASVNPSHTEKRAIWVRLARSRKGIGQIDAEMTNRK